VTLIDDNVGATQGRAIDEQADAKNEPAAPALRDTAKGGAVVASAQPGAAGMRVKKRSGALEPVDVNKIVNSIARASEGLLGVDPMRVATRTISALADGATARPHGDGDGEGEADQHGHHPPRAFRRRREEERAARERETPGAGPLNPSQPANSGCPLTGTPHAVSSGCSRSLPRLARAGG